MFPIWQVHQKVQWLQSEENNLEKANAKQRKSIVHDSREIQRTNPRRFLWSTMSRFGNASHNCSIVVTFVKPRFFAMSAMGPWPLIKQCFLWNSVYIFNGLCDIITCSALTGMPRIWDNFAAFDERNSLPAFVTKTVGIRNWPDVVTNFLKASRV